MLDKVHDAQLLRRLVDKAGDAEKLASVLGKLAPGEVPMLEKLMERFPDVAKLDRFLSRVPANELLKIDAAVGAGKLSEAEAALQALSGKLSPDDLLELRTHLLQNAGEPKPPGEAHNAAAFAKLNQSLGVALRSLQIGAPDWRVEVAMEREIDGARIYSESDFHREISSLLEFGEYYGQNLDALWDRLSTDVERPLTLVWKNSAMSKTQLGDAFDRIVNVLQRVKNQDEVWGLADHFDFRLT